MSDVLLTSFPLRASIAALLALGAIVVLFAVVIALIRLATPGGRKGSRPAPFIGPQESLDITRPAGPR